MEPPRQLARECRADRLDRRLVAQRAFTGRLLERVDRVGERERMPLGDERAQPAGDAGQPLEISPMSHPD